MFLIAALDKYVILDKLTYKQHVKGPETVGYELSRRRGSLARNAHLDMSSITSLVFAMT